jgi:hypothetical protein
MSRGVVATGGGLPENLGELLRAMRETIPDLTESDLRAAIMWSLRRSQRQGALAERKLRAEAVARGLRLVGR